MKRVRPRGRASRGRPRVGRLFEPIDIASLVYFRIAFGLLMLWDLWRYHSLGRIESYFIEPGFYFTYLGFDWVRPWPGDGMYVHFAVMGVLAAFLAVGFLYRLSALLFFLTYTQLFLIDQSQYQNHYYLICLVSFVLIFMPAHRTLSVDAWIRGAAWRSSTAPAWTIWTLRVQMGFVYFFAGVAKLNGDWLRGYPLRDWLQSVTHIPLIGPYLTEVWAALLASWGGMALDLFVFPALLWRRTRPFALAAAISFHLMNEVWFNIGIFPWLSIATTLLFLDPDWPRRLLRLRPLRIEPASAALGTRERVTAALVATFVAIQVLVPLRHFVYPGTVSWTEEGHRFAWHQKLRAKRSMLRFVVTDPATGRSWVVDPGDHLTPRQHGKMVDRPYMILHFAHHLAEIESRKRGSRVEVRATSLCSLNGRDMQPLIDSAVDLAAEPRTWFARHDWIVPLEVPLEAQWDGKSPPTHPVAIALVEEHRDRLQSRVARPRWE